MAIAKDRILHALTDIPGPDGRTPLPQSGVLSDISIQGAKVYFSIAIDPQRSMELEPMRVAAERAVKGVRGVESALVTLTSERPASQERPVGPKAAVARAKANVAGVRHILAVASGKGGVGKSTTACNLAVALGRMGLRVGLLDADIYGPSVPRLMGLREQKPMVLESRLLEPLEAYGLKVMSIGFMVDEDSAMIWRGPMVMSALQQMLREVAWGELDILVVDMPPGTGDAQLTMAQSVPLSGAVIVSTPQDLALLDARRGIAMFRRVEVPILGLIENMSYFLCPSCGTRSDIFGHGGAREEAAKLGVPFLGELPLHMQIRELSDAGKPVVASAPESGHAAAYLNIANAVSEALQGQGAAKRAPRIVIET